MSDSHDATDLLAGMGWEPLPYGCVGIVRKRDVGSDRVWSWLIMVPWAMNDSKPWIDGTRLYSVTALTEEDQRAEILGEMRTILDGRYGEAVAGRAVADFLGDIE